MGRVTPNKPLALAKYTPLGVNEMFIPSESSYMRIHVAQKQLCIVLTFKNDVAIGGSSYVLMGFKL